MGIADLILIFVREDISGIISKSLDDFETHHQSKRRGEGGRRERGGGGPGWSTPVPYNPYTLCLKIFLLVVDSDGVQSLPAIVPIVLQLLKG